MIAFVSINMALIIIANNKCDSDRIFVGMTVFVIVTVTLGVV